VPTVAKYGTLIAAKIRSFGTDQPGLKQIDLGLPTCVADLATAAIVSLFQPAKAWSVAKDIFGPAAPGRRAVRTGRSFERDRLGGNDRCAAA